MSELNGQRILVTGGGGLAGSGAVRVLAASHPGAEILVPRRGEGGATVAAPNVTYVKADMLNPDDCLRVAQGCEMSVMAAANTGGAAASRDAPWLQVTDNVVMDALMLQAFHDGGVRRVVYISTASAYQPFDGFIREDQLDWNADPHDTYFGVGWAKRYGEKLCEFWRRKTGMEFAVLRLANVFGPYARFDPGVSNFIAAITRKAVDHMDPFVVWGSPDVTRDVLYCDDFGDAVAAALCAPEMGFEVFNIGSGLKTTVGEVVNWAIEAAGHAPSTVQYGETSPEAIAFRALDVTKAREVLGWEPRIGPREGVRRTVEWWQGNQATWNR